MKSKLIKRTEAEARQQAYDKLSAEQKAAKLIPNGSTKQRRKMGL